MYTFIFFINIVFANLPSDDAQNSAIDPSNDQLQPVFNEELADKFFNKIDWQIVKTAAEMSQKRKLFKNIVQSVNGKSTIREDEANLFKPIYPNKLETIETAQPINNKYERVLEILQSEYKGPISEQISDMLTYFVYYNNFVKNRTLIQNRLLLYGQPGTGKTYLVQELSNALQIPYCSITASSFLDKYIGESSRKIEKTFSAVNDFNKPILLFIDEIDAIASHRNLSTHNESRAMLATLLVALQKLQKIPHVFVIVATNDKEALDKALLDRFSGATCEVKPLCQKDKVKLLEKLCKNQNIANYTGYPEALANILQANHFSNRDLEAIVTSARAKYLAAFERNEGKCQEIEAMHKYFRKAIDATGKDVNYPWRETFGSGI